MMKKRLLALALALALVLSMTACGSSGPTQQDAKECLQATMDLMLTGEYDENYEFSDMTREEAMAMRADTFEEGFVDSFLESLDLGDITLPEDYLNGLAKKLLDYTNLGLSKVTYTIGEGEQNDAGYSFPVTFNPIAMYDIGDFPIEDKAMEYAQANMSKLQSMSQADMQADLMMAVMDMLVEQLMSDLDNPKNVDPVDVNVQVNITEDNLVEVDGDSLDDAMTTMMEAMIPEDQ